MKVTYKGEEYKVTDSPDFTGRELPDHLEGYKEFSAPGEDGEGFEVEIFWVIEYNPDIDLDDLKGWDTPSEVISYARDEQHNIDAMARFYYGGGECCPDGSCPECRNR